MWPCMPARAPKDLDHVGTAEVPSKFNGCVSNQGLWEDSILRWNKIYKGPEAGQSPERLNPGP